MDKEMTGAGNEPGTAAGKKLDLPPKVEEVFREFRASEFATPKRGGSLIA
jgi:hypothetical protein